jgi:glycosyltransferase involved in cell wall biosynthesis
MSIGNERKNALNPRILCLCTTKKIEEAIKRDGGNPINVGFGLDMGSFVDFGEERKNYLAIMYHDMPSKKYDVAVQVADILFDKGIIEGVISFGGSENYNKHKHPKGLKAYYGNATKAGVADVFNQCKAYLMPSVSEGLNLTPIESTLCGCPSIIVDGAIGEIFNDFNCKIVDSDSIVNMEYMIAGLMVNDRYSELFKANMQEVIKGYTWANVANKIKEVL